MHFSKQGKYSIVNKSTTSALFCRSYLNPLTFKSFLHESQQWKFWAVFSEKPLILQQINPFQAKLLCLQKCYKWSLLFLKRVILRAHSNMGILIIVRGFRLTVRYIDHCKKAGNWIKLEKHLTKTAGVWSVWSPVQNES